jgi:hypothetical protein
MKAMRPGISSTVELLLGALIVIELAAFVHEYRASASPVKFLAMSAAALGGGILLWVYGRGEPWIAVGVIALIAFAELVHRRTRGRTESPAESEKAQEQVLTAQEIRLRAVAERAERNLAGRGSHPLGHPGSGGRLPE